MLPASALSSSLLQARKQKDRAVAVMVTAAHCPWCQLLIEEQLIPRMRSTLGPRLSVISFDLGDTRPVSLPPAPKGPQLSTISPLSWVQQYGYKVAPTVVMVSAAAQPLFDPLVGYSSRDFYGAYLDEAIVRAHHYWMKLT